MSSPNEVPLLDDTEETFDTTNETAAMQEDGTEQDAPIQDGSPSQGNESQPHPQTEAPNSTPAAAAPAPVPVVNIAPHPPVPQQANITPHLLPAFIAQQMNNLGILPQHHASTYRWMQAQQDPSLLVGSRPRPIPVTFTQITVQGGRRVQVTAQDVANEMEDSAEWERLIREARQTHEAARRQQLSHQVALKNEDGIDEQEGGDGNPFHDESTTTNTESNEHTMPSGSASPVNTFPSTPNYSEHIDTARSFGVDVPPTTVVLNIRTLRQDAANGDITAQSRLSTLLYEVCPCCRNTFVTPIRTACGHIVCMRCAYRWIDRVEGLIIEQKPSCPACREVGRFSFDQFTSLVIYDDTSKDGEGDGKDEDPACSGKGKKRAE